MQLWYASMEMSGVPNTEDRKGQVVMADKHNRRRSLPLADIAAADEICCEKGKAKPPEQCYQEGLCLKGCPHAKRQISSIEREMLAEREHERTVRPFI